MLLDELRVEPPRRLSEVCLFRKFTFRNTRAEHIVLLLRIESFDFFLVNAFIKVAGRGQHEIVSIGQIHPFGQHLRIEDNGKESVAQ